MSKEIVHEIKQSIEADRIAKAKEVLKTALANRMERVRKAEKSLAEAQSYLAELEQRIEREGVLEAALKEGL